MTDQEIMKKYFDIITADFRSCYTGVDMMKAGFEKGTLKDMVDVLKEFFVGVGSQGIIDFNEINNLRPNLFPDNNVWYNYDGEILVSPTDSFNQHVCLFQEPEENQNIILVKIIPGVHCKLQAVNCKMIIEVYGSSRLECYAFGSDIEIVLYGQASAIMINVDNNNPVVIDNKGLGAYHYKEVKFNT